MRPSSMWPQSSGKCTFENFNFKYVLGKDAPASPYRGNDLVVSRVPISLKSCIRPRYLHKLAAVLRIVP